MTDFQEKTQTGILTLCFHSRHLTFMGLVVIKGFCTWLSCELKFSAVCMSFLAVTSRYPYSAWVVGVWTEMSALL